MKISAIIAIKDVDIETYRKSIDSVYDWVDEMIVADIGMTRQMRDDIERLKKITLLDYPKGVAYIELIRQQLVDTSHGDWVLYLDADEVFPHTLLTYLSQHSESCDYFSIPRKNIIFKKWMRHSRWWPDPQIRFFKRYATKWSTTIHSQPELKGTRCDVPSEESYAIEHYNYLTYDQYAEKSRRYARGEAEKLRKAGSFTLMKALQLGLSEFVSRYFASEGYKDGMHGLVMAFSQFLYYFQVYVYYWEQHGYPDEKGLNRLPQKFFTQALYETLFWTQSKLGIKGTLQKVKIKVLTILLHRNGA